jgi:hypothetical protein
MGLFAAAGAAAISYQEWQRLSAVDEAEALVSIIGSANRFVEVMALERGVYNQVIVSRADWKEKQRLVSERIAETDGVFDATLTGLAALPASQAAPLRTPVAEARRIVTAARAQADEVWQAGVTEHSPNAARALVSEFVKAAGVLDGTMIRLERALAEKDPRLGLLIGVSRLSNEMREAAGQRSTLLSRYAGTMQKHDAAVAGTVSELTGEIKITWERLQRVVRQVGHSPKVEAAVEHTRSTFMTDGERTYAAMAQAAREGSALPMDFLAWRKWTVAMLTNTLAARDAPIAQALDDIADLRRAANGRLTITLAGAAGAVFIVIGTGVFFERRVIRPIARLTKAIDRDADDDGVEGGREKTSDLADQTGNEKREARDM